MEAEVGISRETGNVSVAVLAVRLMPWSWSCKGAQNLVRASHDLEF